MLRITVNTIGARKRLRKIAKGMSVQGQRNVIMRAAWITHARLVRSTPKRWTGQTRRGWTVIAASDKPAAVVTNISRVMTYLERGTRAHGPVRARKLFIPLTRKAAQAGAAGVMRANRQLSLEQTFGTASARRRPPFVYGRDYVFAKRVRGIRAMRIVAYQRVQSRVTLRMAMVQHVRSLAAS